jgi:hypothetical protein
MMLKNLLEKASLTYSARDASIGEMKEFQRRT